ncbi:MAG: hypothetical protein WD361_06555, partial [Gracilimonas sp.]
MNKSWHSIFGFALIILTNFFTSEILIAQNTDAEQDSTLQQSSSVSNISPFVYLDCQRCDKNHIRQEIGYINYVRDPMQADIHLFITAQETGDGGTEYELSFIGRKRFSELEYSFKKLIDRDATWDETREELNRA